MAFNPSRLMAQEFPLGAVDAEYVYYTHEAVEVFQESRLPGSKPEQQQKNGLPLWRVVVSSPDGYIPVKVPLLGEPVVSPGSKIVFDNLRIGSYKGYIYIKADGLKVI